MTYPYKPHFVGQYLDVLDLDHKWLEAQVIAIEGSNLGIHYLSWNSKYDEWISNNSDRIAPFRKHTICPFPARKKLRLRVGKQVCFYDYDALDSKRKATIVSLEPIEDSGLKLVKLSFEGFSKYHDLFVYSDSRRLQSYRKEL